MKITNIDVVGRDIQLVDDFPVSYENHDTTDHVFVRFQTDTDYTGYGEGTALPWFTGETTASMVAFVKRWLVPRLVGESLDDAATVARSFADEFPANPGGKTAVESALLDLRGKRAGVPVRELLGPVVHDELPCIYPIPGVSPSQATELADEGLNAGFDRFKIKATGNVDTDVARVDAVTERLPEAATVRVDANTGWRTFARTKSVIDQLAHPERVEYFEQPVSPKRPDDMRRLWETTGIPVYADEFVHEPSDVERLGRNGLVAGVHLKLAKTGSVVDLAHMARTAAEYDMRVTPVSAFGTSLEVSTVLQFAATVPNLASTVELDPGLVATNPVADPITVGPTTAPPEGPGLGVTPMSSLFSE